MTISLVLTVGRCHVSKATLDFAVAKANQVLFHQQVSNDKKGITEFLKVLRQQTKAAMGQCLFCLEHTGIYNNPLLKALHQLSTNIWVERAVHIQESMGMTRGKTDQVDAKRIALFAYKNRQGRLCGKKPAYGLHHVL